MRPRGQLLRSTVYALLAGVALLFTGSAAFAQGDNSNLLTDGAATPTATAQWRRTTTSVSKSRAEGL